MIEVELIDLYLMNIGQPKELLVKLVSLLEKCLLDILFGYMFCHVLPINQLIKFA